MSNVEQDVDVSVVPPSLTLCPASQLNTPTVDGFEDHAGIKLTENKRPEFSQCICAPSKSTCLICDCAKANADVENVDNSTQLCNEPDVLTYQAGPDDFSKTKYNSDVESDAYSGDPKDADRYPFHNQLAEATYDTTSDMGNQQTNRKTVPEDDDTPDEAKTKCCQVPKKKMKDKNKRTSRGNRSDDLAFESDEVYPFEGRARSESELHDSVELEPFEIVETDDIRFVPGAGTSDVIKSVSEPKFTPIPEEVMVEENDGEELVEGAECSTGKLFYIDRGSKIAEPGTSTAHSTFEFKQIKSKSKPKVTKTEQLSEHLYENVKDAARTQTENPSQSAESALSKSSSGNSSNNVSRQNSKEAIPKPVRKSKKGKQPSDAESGNKESQGDDKQVKNKTKLSVRDSEIDRNIDSVLMLTQTMFSKIKKPEAQITKPADQNQQSEASADIVEGKYENVNVCVKLESTGISIAHKETKQLNDEKRKSKSSVSSQGPSASETVEDAAGLPGGKYENVGVVAKFERTGISIGHKDDDSKPAPKPSKEQSNRKNSSKSSSKGSKESDKNDKKKRRKASDDKEFVQISRSNSTTEPHAPGILHISDSGTLIIKADAKECVSVCPDPKSTVEQPQQEQQPPPQRGMLHISDTGTLIIQSLPKPPSHAPSSERGESHYYENDIIDKDTTDIKIPYEEAESYNTDTSVSHSIDKRALAKSEESRNSEDSVPPSSPSTMDILTEVDEEDEEDDDAFQDDQEEKRKSAEIVEFSESVCKRLSQLLETQRESENEDYLFQSGTYGVYDNIYETLNHKQKCTNGAHCSEQMSYDNVSVDGNKYKLQAPPRSESSSTLKRASGDSERHDETKKSFSSSDDDMPEYFDPRESDTSTVEPKSSGNFDSANFSTGELFRSSRKRHTEESESPQYESVDQIDRMSKELTLPLRPIDSVPGDISKTSGTNDNDIQDKTPTMETVASNKMMTSAENAATQGEAASGRRSVTCTESDLDISEHRDDLSTDSMLADDEEEETMEILFTKTYTEPVEGAEVFLSCTVVNSAYKDENKKSDTWLSDEALEYFEANASEVMSTAFLKAKREMKDIQVCLQNLRRQMEHFHSDHDDISLPEIPVESLSTDYFGLPRKAITD